MDGPSLQLQHDLARSVVTSISQRRPLLHHLNTDSSWLLQIPRPLLSVQHSGRHWFNILIDPWLAGSQSDVAAWFSQQWHATPPAVSSIAAVEALAREVEAHSLVEYEDTSRRSSKRDRPGVPEEGVTLIDAIAISHEFTDHCHKETLLQCHRDIPVFATVKAAALIRSWDHFRIVLDTPPFPGPSSDSIGEQDTDWRQLCTPPLPEWLGIGHLLTPTDALYYHSALLIVFSLPDEKSPRLSSSSRNSGLSSPAILPTAEAIVYTPHGIHAPSLRPLACASPQLEVLALLHGLHDIALSPVQQLNLGAHNGLQAQRLVSAKYWIGTHDAVKVGGGLVKWFLKRRVISLQEALMREEDERREKEGKYGPWEHGRPGEQQEVKFLEVGNGETIVLK